MVVSDNGSVIGNPKGLSRCGRREFLVGMAAVPVLAGAAPASANSFPEWANKRIESALKRFRAWKGKDETVVFPMITDVHSWRTDISDPPDYKDGKMHIPLMMAAAEMAKADFIVDLGDQDFDGASKSAEMLQGRMEATVKLYGSAKVPVLFCLGNHDHGRPLPGSKERPVSNERFGKMFNGMAVAKGHSLKLSPCASWGYYDIPSKRTRAIFLNSSDGSYYGYTREQLQFFADALRVEEKWTVLVFQHYCIVTSIGHWRTYRPAEEFSGKHADIAIRMAEDFCARKKGSLGGVEWDFSSMKDTRFGGFFFGDSHFDNQLDHQHVHYTISQGFGYCFPHEMAYGGVRTPFSRTENTLFELAALKPEKGEVRLFRVGAGDAMRDRGYWLKGFTVPKA